MDTVQISVDSKVRAVLQEIADLSGCTVYQVVAVLLAQHIVKMEALDSLAPNEVAT